MSPSNARREAEKERACDWSSGTQRGGAWRTGGAPCTAEGAQDEHLT